MALIEYCLIMYLRFDVCDVFISALELSSFILDLACNLGCVFLFLFCFLPRTPRGWCTCLWLGNITRSHFSHWVFGFSYQAATLEVSA